MFYGMYAYKKADIVLENKDLLQETKNIVLRIPSVDHASIQETFGKAGWNLEQQIFKDVLWRWDAYKNKVAVSIELSLIDAVHRDFLRAILAHKQGSFDALIYITSVAKEPRFQNVRRDISYLRKYWISQYCFSA